jgi:hypothetical protein
MTPALAELIERLEKQSVPRGAWTSDGVSADAIATLIAAIREREDALRAIIRHQKVMAPTMTTSVELIARRALGEVES